MLPNVIIKSREVTLLGETNVDYLKKISNLAIKNIFHHYGCQQIVTKPRRRKNFFNFMAPFYGWGSTASRLQPLRGGSLLFIIQFPEIPGTHFIDLGRMKG